MAPVCEIITSVCTYSDLWTWLYSFRRCHYDDDGNDNGDTDDADDDDVSSCSTSGLTRATSGAAVPQFVASPLWAGPFARPQSPPSSWNIFPLSQSCCRICLISCKTAAKSPLQLYYIAQIISMHKTVSNQIYRTGLKAGCGGHTCRAPDLSRTSMCKNLSAYCTNFCNDLRLQLLSLVPSTATWRQSSQPLRLEWTDVSIFRCRTSPLRIETVHPSEDTNQWTSNSCPNFNTRAAQTHSGLRIRLP